MIDEKKLIEDIFQHEQVLKMETDIQLAFANGYKQRDVEIRNIIERQPKADWIPFNEPPKEDDTYIVAWLPKGMDSKARAPHYYALWDFENDEWEVDVPESYKNFEIIGIAWQPLPQPCKKEGAENE